MSSSLPPRVRWRERQTVLTADLAAEQAYRLDGRRRHARASHLPGVVSGLALGVEAEGVTVSPGVAVDGWGRTLVLAGERLVDWETLTTVFESLGVESLVLSISGVEQAARNGSARRGCDPAARGRRLEECRLQLSTAAAFSPVPPYLPATDSEIAASSVPLGTISSEGALLPTPRAEAGLVAERVEDPAGRAHIDLAVEPVKERFEVAVRPEPAADLKSQDALAVLDPVRRLTVDRDAKTTVHGDGTVGQSVRLVESGPGPSQRVRFRTLKTTPEEARAWSAYRTDFQATDANGDPVGNPRGQLRFEIGPPAEDADPEAHLFAVGRRVGTRFLPCLRVDSECTVRVASLAVEGQVAESPIPADPNDPRFGAAAAGAWLSGIGAALGQTSSITLAVDSETQVIEPGDDLIFGATATNTGPAQLQDVRLVSSLIPKGGSDPPTIFGGTAVLDPKEQIGAERTYSALALGAYQLVVSVFAVGPGLTPVTASRILEITVQHSPD